jgi:hypothetical protein
MPKPAVHSPETAREALRSLSVESDWRKPETRQMTGLRRSLSGWLRLHGGPASHNSLCRLLAHMKTAGTAPQHLINDAVADVERCARNLAAATC